MKRYFVFALLFALCTTLGAQTKKFKTDSLKVTGRILIGHNTSDYGSAGLISAGDIVIASATVNASMIGLSNAGGSTHLFSYKTGSGTSLPITINTNGLEALRIDNNQQLYVGFTSTDGTPAAGTIMAKTLVTATASTNASTFSMAPNISGTNFLISNHTGTGADLPVGISVGGVTNGLRVTTAGTVVALDSLRIGKFFMAAGAGANKVLTSNANGVGTWQAIAGGASALDDLSDVDIIGAGTSNLLMRRASGVWVDTTVSTVNMWQRNGTLVSPATITDKVAVGTTTAPTASFIVQENNSTTADNGIKIENVGTGDAAIRFAVSGNATSWSVGVDNSKAGDPFVFSPANALGTTANLLSLSSTRVGINVEPATFVFDVRAASDAESNILLTNNGDVQSVNFGWNVIGTNRTGINFNLNSQASSNDLTIQTSGYLSGTGGDIEIDAGADGANIYVERASGNVTIGGTTNGGSLNIDDTGESRGSGWIIDNYFVSTTDATVTTVATISTTSETSYHFRITVVATTSDAATSASYQRMVTYENDGGTLNIVGALNLPYTAEDAGATTWDVTVTTSGTNVLVQVTGAAATTIRWQCTVEKASILGT